MATELAISERNSTQIQRAEAVDPFEPQNWNQLMEFSNMLSKTDFAPKDFKGRPEACAIAMMYGRQLGLGGLQAIQNIAVINGRPSIYGDAMWAVVTSHPAFEDVSEEVTDTYTKVTLKRKGRSPVTSTFTVEDAKKAGLWGKAGPWTQYPKRQMQWRARTFAARDLFPDALKGMVSVEEVTDYNDGPTIEGSVAQATAEKSETTVTATTAANITKDQAKAFGTAYKASGYSTDEAKSKLNEIAGVTSSLLIPTDKYEKVMVWANTKVSPDEKLCREMFGILSYDLTQQAQAIADANGDWSALALKLNAELPAE